MGRASVALGVPDSGSGIMDGSVIGTSFFSTESGRSSSFGIDPVGQTLSKPEASKRALQRQHAHEAEAEEAEAEAEEEEEEVARRQLWFQLSLDERTQFGSCFSRMLLKCLSQTEQEEQEVRT